VCSVDASHLEGMSSSLHAYSNRLGSLIKRIDKLRASRPNIPTPDGWTARSSSLNQAVDLGTTRFIAAIKHRLPPDEVKTRYNDLTLVLDKYIVEATTYLVQMEATPWLS